MDTFNHFNHPSLLLAIPALTFTYVFSVILYRLFLSPVASLPGLWYAKVSDFWLKTHVVRMRQCRAIDDLFKKYGPIVAVGPNTVSFVDAPTLKTIYGSNSRFWKDRWYKSLLCNKHDHAMTTLDPVAHSALKRGYGPHYIPGNLALWQGDYHDFTLEVIQRLEEDAGRTAFDCLTLFRHLMVDVIMLTVFDLRVGAVQKWAADAPDPLSTAINDYPKRSLLRNALPRFLWALLASIPHARWQQFCDADRYLGGFVTSRVLEVKTQLERGDIGEAERKSLLIRLLQFKLPSGELVTKDYVIAELQAHLIAGVDTTATTTSYLLWELSRRPDILAKLRKEIDAIMDDPRAIPNTQALQSLPYLTSFIKEGLRVYSAAPAPLPRVVPDHLKSFDVMGYTIPNKTIIQTQAWTMHRVENVYYRPDEFDPDRWLNESDTMKAHFLPFGHGGRLCAGQNLAMTMLRTIVAGIVRNFDIYAPAETNEKTMTMCDSFVIFPAGLQAKLFFPPRKT